MIRNICIIFTITIEDLEVRLDNSNLPLGKNAIWFESLAQKKRLVSKQLIHYITNIKSLFLRGICLFREILGQNFPSISKSNYHNLSKKSIQLGGWESRGEI